MAEKKSSEKSGGFTEQEKAAMRERARELKEERANKKKVDAEAEVRAKIDEMPEPDRTLGKKLHEIIMSTAPDLVPRTWYGMPAYTLDSKVLCFFQGSAKFGTRYSTLGFNDLATLDEGTMWPTAYALIEINAKNEKAIRQLVKRAAG